MTRQWIGLKKRFFPGLCSRHGGEWDWQTAEVKGTDLRRAVRSADRRERRATFGFIDRTLDLLERFDCTYSARVWIKEPGTAFGGRAVYTSSVQFLCRQFERVLDAQADVGIVIADSRSPAPNVNVSHSVFTQKFGALGDPYPRILEVPVFGHSDNHSALQLVDILASALLTPISCWYFLNGKFQNDHVHPSYEGLAKRYCHRLKSLQLNSRGLPTTETGLVISDPVGRKGQMHLFRAYPPAIPSTAAIPPVDPKVADTFRPP